MPLEASDEPISVKPLADLPKSGGIRAEMGFWPLTAAIVLPLLLCDVSVLPLMSAIQESDYAAVIVYACFGLIAAQGVVLATAHVLGTGSILRRSSIAWIFGTLAVAAWFLGDRFERHAPPVYKEVIGSVCFVPFFALAVQTPLWLARLTLGWRFTHASQKSDPPTSLADFFSVTTLVAVTFGLVQAGKSLIAGVSGSDHTFWPTVGIAWAIVASVSAIVLLPLLWFSLRRRSICASSAYALTAVAIAAVISWIATNVGNRQPRWTWEMTGTSIVYLAIAVGVCSAFWLWQRFGWRLSTGRHTTAGESL